MDAGIRAFGAVVDGVRGATETEWLVGVRMVGALVDREGAGTVMAGGCCCGLGSVTTVGLASVVALPPGRRGAEPVDLRLVGWNVTVPNPGFMAALWS